MKHQKRYSRLFCISIALSTFLVACGGGGSSTPPPPQPSGKLTFTGCAIQNDASNCEASVNWTALNSNTVSLSISGVVESNQAQGTLTFDLSIDSVEIQLINNGVILDEITVRGLCQSATAWDGALCKQFATREDLKAATPFTENGQPVELEVVAFKPLGTGPFPSVMLNHGSTGDGSDPNLFDRTFIIESAAKVFTDRGWMVLFPQRRGRGMSDGLYDEGFNDGRTAYSCERDRTLAGFERANDDIDAILAWMFTQSDIDTSQLIIAGVSRGGILSMVHAARNPNAYVGAINFVGGWLGEGCGDYLDVNRNLFIESASFPTDSIWLYGNNDSFYSIAHSQGNFDAYINAGGQGSFNVYTRATGLNGHFITGDITLWQQDVDHYLNQLP